MCYYHYGESYGDDVAYSGMLQAITNTAPFEAGQANVLYYLAIPPNVFHETVGTLEKIPSAVVAGKSRFVIEKPFGNDTASCQELLDNFAGLGESMQYRLDHYLAVSRASVTLVGVSRNPRWTIIACPLQYSIKMPFRQW